MARAYVIDSGANRRAARAVDQREDPTRMATPPQRIELSLTPGGDRAARAWAAPVRSSADACLLLDAHARIHASSAACRLLLGLPADVDQREVPFLASGVHLVDFSPNAAALVPSEAARIPPLQALHTGALARGLLRVSMADASKTLDVISAPVHDESAVAGSLTFLRRC